MVTEFLDVISEAHGHHRPFLKHEILVGCHGVSPPFRKACHLSFVRIGARVATACPEAEGPSDVPPRPLRDGLWAVAIQKSNCIRGVQD